MKIIYHFKRKMKNKCNIGTSNFTSHLKNGGENSRVSCQFRLDMTLNCAIGSDNIQGVPKPVVRL